MGQVSLTRKSTDSCDNVAEAVHVLGAIIEGACTVLLHFVEHQWFSLGLEMIKSVEEDF